MLKNNNKIYSFLEAKKKLENYCAYQERCHLEVERKLQQMGQEINVKQRIILHLLEADYLNEERFAKAFARGKFSIKKWGKRRIINELKAKNISNYNINSALNQIEPEVYLKTFYALADKRLKQIEGLESNLKRKKLADYLLYRGWESELVYKTIWELIPSSH